MIVAFAYQITMIASGMRANVARFAKQSRLAPGRGRAGLKIFRGWGDLPEIVSIFTVS
jgi:hypothetical protein